MPVGSTSTTPNTPDERDGFDRPYLSAFDLPERLSAKSDPALIGDDERHFAAIELSTKNSVTDVLSRLDRARKAPGRLGQEAMERDMEVHRLSNRLRSLRRFGLDLCLGRMVGANRTNPIYVGRFGLLDDAGQQLLIDWRSPAAEPFFGATHANPMGLASRRRYRWTEGRVGDYWDEVFTADGLASNAALDDQSAFIASLGVNRSARMRDVLGTIAADQDAIVRARSAGALVVDGGPGTGKTVVALHRTAYLLYSDQRLGHNHGGVLFVGPHEPYLAYVSDVLPSLGEDGVLTCAVRDLVEEGVGATTEADPAVARLKSSIRMVRAVERAVEFYEQPPTAPMIVDTEWSDLSVTADDWAEAFGAAEAGTPHNEAREHIRELLVTILCDKDTGDAPRAELRQSLWQNDDLRSALDSAWTLIEAADLVGDLWSVPAYLRTCAPWLDADGVRLLQRDDPQRWTLSDLPLLDAARQRLGDPEASRRARRREQTIVAERLRMDRVVEELIAADDDEHMAAQLRQDGIRDALVDRSALPQEETDPLAGPFAHIVVDEAQELTDAQWQMLLRRCPSRSFTIVGDRAQARNGFTETWRERLTRIGLDRIEVTSLNVNYRTPEEIMAEAEPVIRTAVPDANVPTSIRRSGVPVVHGAVSELESVVDHWLDNNTGGMVCVIGNPSVPDRTRVRSLTPELAKGLEFDLVVLVNPEHFGPGVEGAVDRYVAMTRATQKLVVLS